MKASRAAEDLSSRRLALVAALSAFGGAAIAVCAIFLVPRGSEPAAPGGPPPADDGARSRLLADRIGALEERLAALERSRGGEGTLDARPYRPPPKPESRSEPSTAEPGIDPHVALVKLAEACGTEGGGGEYWRLVVDAAAPLLLEDILRMIRDRSQPALLRKTLLDIVGTGRFRGREDVFEALDAVIVPDDESEVASAALNAFSRVGTPSGALRLADNVAAFEAGDVRGMALKVIANVAQDQANRVLADVFVRSRDDDLRVRVVQQLRTDDVDAALDVYRRVLGQAQPLRLAAAHLVKRFRDDAFLAFVEQWIAQEKDPEVLAALGVSRTAQRTVPAWAAMQAAGPPDTTNINEDSRTAWASQAADAGPEWIELTYDPPLVASEVRIHEVLAAGGVVALSAKDPAGNRVVLWEGTDPLKNPGVASISFRATSFAVRTLRIELDTRRGKGWNEIDAVELVGPSGRGWAKRAIASSSYGENQAEATIQSAGKFLDLNGNLNRLQRVAIEQELFEGQKR